MAEYKPILCPALCAFTASCLPKICESRPYRNSPVRLAPDEPIRMYLTNVSMCLLILYKSTNVVWYLSDESQRSAGAMYSRRRLPSLLFFTALGHAIEMKGARECLCTLERDLYWTNSGPLIKSIETLYSSSHMVRVPPPLVTLIETVSACCTAAASDGCIYSLPQ